MRDPIGQPLDLRSMLASVAVAIVPLPAIALGLALSGSAALGAPAATADPNSPYSAPSPYDPAHRPVVQKHQHHRFSQRTPVRHARLRGLDPDEKAPPAAPLSAPPHQSEEARQSSGGGVPAGAAPGSAYAMKIAPAPEAPPAPSRTEAAAPVAPELASATPAVIAPPAAASERVAADSGAAAAASERPEDPAAAAQRDEAVHAPALEVMLLFGTCGTVAAGCLALVAFGARRRRKRAQGLAPPRRNPARLLSPPRDRTADRASMQRLFPHQFGAAIRG